MPLLAADISGHFGAKADCEVGVLRNRDLAEKDSAERGVLRFARDNSGGVTVEFVIWLPFFFLIMALIVEVSLLLLTQSNMWTVARDTARRIATHEFDQAAAEAHATSAMTFGGHAYTIAADATGPDISVTITTSVRDVLLFTYGPMSAFGGTPLVAEVILREEPS